MTNLFEAFGLLLVAIVVVIYFFAAYVLYKVGRKFGIGSFWHYLVPFYNMVLICRCGGVSPWNVLGLMIFPVSIYSTVNIWGSVAERLGKSYWLYGITILFFGVPVFILAFDRSMPGGNMGFDIREPIIEPNADADVQEKTDSVGEQPIVSGQTVSEGEHAETDEVLLRPESDAELKEETEAAGGKREKPVKNRKGFIDSLRQSGMFSSFAIKQINELVGIDIGTTSVKICTLKELKDGFTVQNVVKKTYEQPLISDGHIVDIDFMSRELQEIFKANNIKTKNVACAISSYSVISKTISVPFMDDEALESTISVEVENTIPFPLKDIYYSYYVLGVDAEKQSMMNVKLVAVKKEIVDAYMATFNMAGLNLQILDVDMFGVSNTVEQIYAPKESSVLIADIGASVTNIAILNGESIEFTREILIGGKYLTEQIQKSIKTTYAEAEQKKIGGDSDVAYLFEDFIFNIASEINKTVRFYLATKPKENIGKIFVTGGSSLLPGIKEKIVDETGIPVEVVDPFLQLSNMEGGQTALYGELKEFMAVPVYLSRRVKDLMV